MTHVKVARLLFRLSGLAQRTGLKDTRLGRAAARLAGKLLGGPRHLPASALTFEVEGLAFTFPRDSAFVFARPDFERGTRHLLAQRLGPGMTAVDVGANVGFLTAWMARAVGPTGRLYSVEPAPSNLPYLRHNVEANGLAQVEVLAMAAGATSRPRRLHFEGRRLAVRGRNRQRRQPRNAGGNCLRPEPAEALDTGFPDPRLRIL